MTFFMYFKSTTKYKHLVMNVFSKILKVQLFVWYYFWQNVLLIINKNYNL